MRSTYLRAVLRQDVGYFDLNVTITSEVITSVANDTLVIQDALSVKVKSDLMFSHAVKVKLKQVCNPVF